MRDLPTLEQLHRTVCSRTPGAHELAAAELVSQLIVPLRRRFGRIDIDLVQEAVHDTVMAYLSQPDRYDLTRGVTLLQLLGLYARRRVLDRLRVECRRQSIHLPLSELTAAPAINADDARPKLFGMIRGVLKCINSPADRKLAILRFKGERRTSHLASAIGIDGLPYGEQQLVVKRAKDRIDKAVASWRRGHSREIDHKYAHS